MGQVDLFKQINSRKQAIFGLFAVVVLVFSALASTMVSGLALSSYSITPSTASISADEDSVSYTVEFTPETSAVAYVIDFCTNSPLVGQSCTAPTGLDVETATIGSGTGTFNEEATRTANKLVVDAALTADSPYTITFEDITNPNTVGAVYARIVTFGTTTAAEEYTSTVPGTWVDTGSVSMYFNESITVSGTVLETMTFCVADVALTPSCANADSALASIVLGDETTGLTAGTVHQSSLFTQMNTNAASGAVVWLRSSTADCGGLVRPGAANCDIAPGGTAGFTDASGAARFGVKLGTVASTTASGSTAATGTVQAATGSSYNATAFKMNFVALNASGVTGPLGDPLLDTDGAMAIDQNMELIFGATSANNTPAGTYSTDLNLIAVGKF